jgi:hypothetical protein
MKPEDKAVAQQALEAFEKLSLTENNEWVRDYAHTQATALRQLLEQPAPVQEPWGLAEKVRRDLDRQSCPGVYMDIAVESIVKHYTTPPAQPADHSEQHLDMVDLDEIAEFCRITFGKGAADFNAGVDAMLAELKLRQKNGITTPPAQPAGPDYKQLYEQLCEQYDVLVNELKPAQPAVDLRFLKQVVAVAIAGLFEHYKDDVLRVFTLDELQAVVDLSDALRPQQVEDIYKRAWEMLTTPPAQPAAWVGLTNGEIDLFINGRGDEDDDDYVEPTGDGFGLTDADLITLVRRAEAKLREKNGGGA